MVFAYRKNIAAYQTLLKKTISSQVKLRQQNASTWLTVSGFASQGPIPQNPSKALGQAWG